MPHAAPISVGTTSNTDAPARVSTAAEPATAASTIARLPTGMRDRSHCEATAATVPITISTIADKNNLSAVPNVWMAHSLTGPGVRSITDEPTAVRASALEPNGTATRALTPRAIAAAARPTSGEVRDVAVGGGVRAVTAIRPRYRLGLLKSLPERDVNCA